MVYCTVYKFIRKIVELVSEYQLRKTIFMFYMFIHCIKFHQ